MPEISNAPRTADYLITLRLGNGRERWPLGPVNYHFKRPDETGPRNRFPFFVCHDWEEWLIKLAAHEAKHIEQFRNDLPCSEISCERFAVATLDAFRSLRGPREESRAGMSQLSLEARNQRVTRLQASKKDEGRKAVSRSRPSLVALSRSSSEVLTE